MTCHTCRFYRPDTCRRHSPSATGWPAVQPDDICGEWEAAIAIPEAMQQLGEIRDVVGVATTWRNAWMPTAEDAGADGTVWVWINGIRSPLASSWKVVASEFRPGRLNPPYWLPGYLPAPTDPPPGWEPPAPTDPPPDAEPPTPSAPRWIIDRLPTAEDGDEDGDVAVSVRPGAPGKRVYGPWAYVHPGTPWAPTDAIPDEPFDPTTLDRNGWIRSRLPGEGDADGDGEVNVPKFSDVWTWFTASHIVPGQPWAPADSSPGEYQP